MNSRREFIRHHAETMFESLDNRTSTFEGTPTASVYQCQCYFVGIKPFERTLNTAGEILHDAYMRARSDQFEILADISSATELGPIELGAFGACKTLAVVQSPQSIIFQDLCPGGEHRVVTIANFSEYSPRVSLLHDPSSSVTAHVLLSYPLSKRFVYYPMAPLL